MNRTGGRFGQVSSELLNLIGTIANVGGLAVGILLVPYGADLGLISFVIAASIAIYIVFRFLAYLAGKKEAQGNGLAESAGLRTGTGRAIDEKFQWPAETNLDLQLSGDVKLVRKPRLGAE